MAFALIRIQRYGAARPLTGDDAKNAPMLGDDPLNRFELRELESYLTSQRGSSGMDLVELDGFLCAIACAPGLVSPGAWLPHIFGDAGPPSPDQRHAERIIGLVFRYYNDTMTAARAGSYEPRLPLLQPQDTENRAQLWAKAFIRGMSLDSGWQRLVDDGANRMLLMPIFMLADASELVEDPTPDAKASEGIISMLPRIVTMIQHYWSAGPPAPTRRKQRVRATPAQKRTVEKKAEVSFPRAAVHRLKIQLLGIKPSIWRRVEIPSDTVLPKVSRMLLTAMGWEDSHLHAFHARGVTYADPDEEFPNDDRDERRVTLANLAPFAKDRFEFDYDFGDNWQHRVDVEAIVEAEDGIRYPRCTAGRRACPPEDCGGTWGYESLLEILADPKHEEHDSMIRWAGGRIDPDAFDLNATDARLAKFGPRKRGGAKRHSGA